jgi:hypothetical protein
MALVDAMADMSAGITVGAGVGATVGVGAATAGAEVTGVGVAAGLAVAVDEQPVTIAAIAIIEAASFLVLNKAVLLLHCLRNLGASEGQYPSPKVPKILDAGQRHDSIVTALGPQFPFIPLRLRRLPGPKNVEFFRKLDVLPGQSVPYLNCTVTA